MNVEEKMNVARMLVAQAWCKKSTRSTPMDVNLALEFSKILSQYLNEENTEEKELEFWIS